MALKRKGESIIDESVLTGTMANINKAEKPKEQTKEETTDITVQAVKRQEKNKCDELETAYPRVTRTITLNVHITPEIRMQLDQIKIQRRTKGQKCTYDTLMFEAIVKLLEKHS